MKLIYLFSRLIVLFFQGCSDSSNNQLKTLINDVIIPKEAFIEKSLSNVIFYVIKAREVAEFIIPTYNWQPLDDLLQAVGMKEKETS
jgi:hypothetical protein